MADETPDPVGKESAKSRDAGRPARATQRALKARGKTPDLDARNERMIGPRKPMGPPLKESSPSSARRRAVSGATVKPTDPETATRRARKAKPAGRKRAAKARRTGRRRS
jgi:hypothetical protein